MAYSDLAWRVAAGDGAGPASLDRCDGRDPGAGACIRRRAEFRAVLGLRSLNRPIEQLLATLASVFDAAPDLPAVLGAVRRAVECRMATTPLDVVKARAEQVAPPRNPMPVLAGGEVCVIAQVSPDESARGGTERVIQLVSLASEFEAGGAHCLSVWTDAQVHGASCEDLSAVRSGVDTPILARDFILCSYQLWEARAAGADMVLITAAFLEAQALVSLVERTTSLGMVPVVQVLNEVDVANAAHCGATLFAIHAERSRGRVRTETTGSPGEHEGRRRFSELAPLLPSDCLRIADVGVRDPHELIEFGQAGADAVVIGATLTSTKRPKAAVHDLVTAGSHPAVRHARH